MTYRITPHSDELCHYGVLGMRWGVRRYQNYDGTRIGTGGTPVINKAKTAEGSVKKLKGTMDKAFNNSVSGGQGGKAKGNARLAAIANPKIGKTLKNAKFAAAAREAKPNSSKEKDNSKDNSQQIKNDVRGAKNDANSLTEASKKLTNIGKKHDPKIKQVGEKASRDAKKMSDQELRETINRIKMEREYQSLKESEVSSGWDKANDILDIVGTVVLIAGNIASLYLAYKSLKHDDADIPYAEAELYNYMIENNFDEEVIQHFMAMDDEYVDDFLEHYGVLGMKWGVRRYQNYDGTRIGAGKNPVIDQVKKAGSAMSTSRQMNANALRPGGRTTNKSVGSGAGGGGGGSSTTKKADNNKAVKRSVRDTIELIELDLLELEDRINKDKLLGKDTELSELEYLEKLDKHDELLNRFGNIKLDQLAASAKKPKVRSDGKDESKFTPQQKRVSNDARKDAEEFARAKAFYGEGAGNRRKAIKTTVESKKKKDSFYAEEFEYHLSQQDMEDHMRKAKAERQRKDVAIGTRKGLNKANRALGQLSRYL